MFSLPIFSLCTPVVDYEVQRSSRLQSQVRLQSMQIDKMQIDKTQIDILVTLYLTLQPQLLKRNNQLMTPDISHHLTTVLFKDSYLDKCLAPYDPLALTTAQLLRTSCTSYSRRPSGTPSTNAWMHRRLQQPRTYVRHCKRIQRHMEICK